MDAVYCLSLIAQLNWLLFWTSKGNMLAYNAGCSIYEYPSGEDAPAATKARRESRRVRMSADCLKKVSCREGYLLASSTPYMSQEPVVFSISCRLQDNTSVTFQNPDQIIPNLHPCNQCDTSLCQKPDCLSVYIFCKLAVQMGKSLSCRFNLENSS